jgi:stearoyl-CoA desaturase (delta-9 desaturase)
MSFSSIDFSRGVNWIPSLVIGIYQILLVLMLPFYFYYSPPSVSIWFASLILLYLTGLSITAGYHRFYAHRSYKAHPIVEFVLLFFGSMALQGSALRWAYEHRKHHAFVDTDKDPYSIKKGFWYAHMFWLLEKPDPIDSKFVPDLIQNPRVAFQNRHSILLMVITNMVAFFAVGLILEDWLGAFVMCVWFRMFCLHHFTWFINSLAHTWGDKPFSQEQSAVNNYIISLLTFGEGYHNYHHTFANDYRNGVRWYHFDPTKWLIFGLSYLGLAYNLKRIDKATIQKKMVAEKKNLLLEQLKDIWDVKKEEFEKIISDASDKLIQKINDLQQLKKQYKEAKLLKQKDVLLALRQQLKTLKRDIHSDWKQWKKLTSQVRRVRTLPAS